MTVDYFNKHYIVIKSITKVNYNSALLVVQVCNQCIMFQDNAVTEALAAVCTYQILVQSINFINDICWILRIDIV